MSGEQIDLRGAVADDGETVLACPACDSTRVWARGHAGVHSRGRAVDGRWRCKDCGETFADGVERERHAGGGQATHGLARRLEAADPSEVLGDE